MSDHFNRPQGGDDPLADRLRAFGSETAHSAQLPPVDEIHRGGDRRRRNQRIVVGAATLAVAAVIGGTVVASQMVGRGDETLLPATQTPTPTQSATPTQTASEPVPTLTVTSTPTQEATASTAASVPTATVTQDSPTYPGTRTDVVAGSSSFVLPEGWTATARDSDLGHIDRPDAKVHSLCLRDGTPRPTDIACDISIEVGETLLGAEGQRVWEPGQVDGWSDNSGATVCPGKDDGEDYMVGGVKPTKSFADVGAKTAEKYTYAMPCQSGLTFTVTQHWLPTSHIRITDYLANDRTEDILGSFRFTGS
ncbi:hypothetical protein N802_12980 [Knoellia sinensis KCTC 19936]|uniref:Uncharacterized protein n=1 Tax=Knoellia sinensis KCTC 19936 TaxID=1385520 RepID=A0A0A0JBS8_9MICO|nr:APA family fibronectin-binding glycoprotein [Knoellia sinensis]KGN34269.1 hypothetical protein N802_12980 [Knoellia sinensis KCTC 19936]